MSGSLHDLRQIIHLEIGSIGQICQHMSKNFHLKLQIHMIYCFLKL